MPKRHDQFKKIPYWPVQKIDGKLCATERGSNKKHYEQARRCELENNVNAEVPFFADLF
jgi:hypothetical protein